MISLRPFDLAARQDELDREATRHFPDLLQRKRQRQLLSPHGLLRGSAPLFYEILASRPDLAQGPDGTGWLVGDMHLENVGAYHDDQHEVIFNLNDFDDAAIGPWRLDVLRLSTSVLLSAHGAGGPRAMRLLDALYGAYVPVACGQPGEHAPQVTPPPVVTRLLGQVNQRTMDEMLDERCPVHHGRRRFERGSRYRDLPQEVADAVPQLLKTYIEVLGPRAPAHAHKWDLLDAAQRIAGTGSLGSLRIAILVRNHAGEERILDMKQQRPSSVDALLPVPPGEERCPADRVVAAATATLPSPPQLLAAMPHNLFGSFICRKLRPQEDKLDLTSLDPAKELEPLVRTVGDLLARGHRRAAKQPPVRPWSGADIEHLCQGAIELAGLFEATYLAYARLVGAAASASTPSPG